MIGVLVLTLLAEPDAFAQGLKQAADRIEAGRVASAREQLALLAPEVEHATPRERAYFHRTRGYLALRMARPGEATEAFALALAEDSLTPIHTSEVRSNLVSLFLFGERYDDAAALLALDEDRLMRKSREAMLAHVFYKTGRMDRALANLLRAMEGSAALERALDEPDESMRCIVCVPPMYPREASERGITGWVILRFRVSRTGEVLDPVVVAAEPKAVFEEAALKAVQKWQYPIKLVRGRAVEYEVASLELEFKS